MTYRAQAVTAGNCGACKRTMNSPAWQELIDTIKKYPQLEFDHLDLPSMATKTPAGYPPTILRAWFPMLYIVSAADYKEGKMNKASIFSGKFTESGDLENTDQPMSLAPQWVDAQMKARGISPSATGSRPKAVAYQPAVAAAPMNAADEEKSDSSHGTGQTCQLYLSRTFG